MILDTSAIVALLKREAGYENIAIALDEAFVNRMSTGTLLELWIVATGGNREGLTFGVDRFLADVAPIIEPVTEAQATIARDAYRQFGKGSGHPARLNFGDCFAYALARERNEPLLFVGDDFIHTDITPALAP